MSITSIAGAGDEEGRGGVVMFSSAHLSVQSSVTEEEDKFYLPRPFPAPNRFDVNKDLRGVASCGLP